VCARVTQISPVSTTRWSLKLSCTARREEALVCSNGRGCRRPAVGLSTNAVLLRQCSPSFAVSGQSDTALIPREVAVLFTSRERSACGRGAQRRLDAADEQRGLRDPFSRRDGWQTHGVTQRPLISRRLTLRYPDLGHGGVCNWRGGRRVGPLAFAQSAIGIDIHCRANA
jgi:3-methylcrotonyl-CoA carboxylase alpha subunit